MLLRFFSLLSLLAVAGTSHAQLNLNGDTITFPDDGDRWKIYNKAITQNVCLSWRDGLTCQLPTPGEYFLINVTQNTRTPFTYAQTAEPPVASAPFHLVTTRCSHHDTDYWNNHIKPYVIENDIQTNPTAAEQQAFEDYVSSVEEGAFYKWLRREIGGNVSYLEQSGLLTLQGIDDGVPDPTLRWCPGQCPTGYQHIATTCSLGFIDGNLGTYIQDGAFPAAGGSSCAYQPGTPSDYFLDDENYPDNQGLEITTQLACVKMDQVEITPY